MESNNINSCLMWTTALYTPIDLRYVIDENDLKDTGVELDTHVTLIYAQGKRLPKTKFISDIQEILGPVEYEKFNQYCELDNYTKVLDFFELSFFENDSDYLILKLKKSAPMFNMVQKINKGLSNKYNVKSDFASYTPHMTLAELNPGTASKYLESETLGLLLNDTVVDFEDIVVSYGSANEPEDRQQFFLTQYKNVDRYFRLEHLKRETIT